MYLSDPQAALSLPLFTRLGRKEVDTCPVREEGVLRNVPWLTGPRAQVGGPQSMGKATPEP